jgi:small subunit ribosomal protein S2
MPVKEVPEADSKVEALFGVGAHFGYVKSRRHPTATRYLFGMKQRTDIFDLEQTSARLEEALTYVRSLGRERKQLLFVSGKPEGIRAIKAATSLTGAPFVAGRWIGGTLTNFSEIRKRIARLEDLTNQRERGELTKYTKFERLHIDREIEKLDLMYGGLIPLGEKLPHSMYVVDPKKEAIAIKEARAHNIPVIALASSDCDLSLVDYPIPANDASQRSIDFITEQIAHAYHEGLQEQPVIVPEPAQQAKQTPAQVS